MSGVLIFPLCLLLLEMLPKRSDPLTPRVNRFHFVGENRRMLRCLFCFPPRDLSSRMQLQLHPVCSAGFPRDPKHTDPETRSKSGSEKQLPLSSFRPQITEPDMTRRSFSSAERVLLSGGWGSLRLLSSSFPAPTEATQRGFHLWRR